MDMISASLRDWLRIGVLGPLRLGMSRAQVRGLLGPATNTSIRRAAILRYGDVELHFPDGEELRLVHMDGFGVPEGAGTLSLDPWVIRGGMARAELERALAEAGIPYRPAPPRDPDSGLLVTKSGVELIFVERQGPYSPPPGLFSASQSAPASPRGLALRP